MATFNKFYCFTEDLTKGVHSFNTHAFKIALTASNPVPTNALLVDVSEIASGNGYTAGGGAVTYVSASQALGVTKLVMTGPTFTASGGSIAGFRYAVLYNSTATTPLKPLVSWWDYGTSVVITNGNSFTVNLDAVNGLFTVQ